MFACSRPKPKTVRSFEKRIGELMARVGSNDLRKITPKHVDDWASDLLIAGLEGAAHRA